MKKYISVVVFLLVNSILFCQKLSLVNTFHIASPGGWDYLKVSPVHDWLYVSHGTQVNILNKTSGDSVDVILNTPGVHGIAFDEINHKGFISNGRGNSVTVFDINTNATLAQIPTGANPDAITYEPFTKTIITCNGRGKNLTMIDPATNKVLDSIVIGGKPETAVSDDHGLFYVNVEDKNEIAVVDLKTKTVIHHWSLLPAEEPTGLAYNANTHRLFAGCDKSLVVLDSKSGEVKSRISIGEGCDGVSFDPVTKRIYTANGSGTVTVIHEDDADHYTILENAISKRGARTITLDEKTHTIYLPTADFLPLPVGQQGRPPMKPGSFQILVMK